MINRFAVERQVWCEESQQLETHWFTIEINPIKLPQKAFMKAFLKGKSTALFGAFKLVHKGKVLP